MKRWIASILSLALLCNTFTPVVWAEDAASAAPEVEVTETAEEPFAIEELPVEEPSGEELPAAEEILSLEEPTEQAEVPPLAAGNEAPAAEQVESMDASDYIFQAGGTQSTGGGNIMLLDLYDEDAIADLEALIYPALQNRVVEVPIQSVGLPCDDHGKKLILTAFSNVINSHPELYYVNNTYSMYSNGTHFTRIVFGLLYTDEQIDSYNSQLQAAVDRAKSYVLPGMSPLQIAMVLHDYLALTNHYNAKVASGQKADNDQVYDIIGALLNGDAVCQGYTLAYELLLNEYGIENSTVSSSAINHIWNQVCLGGKWYNVDVTWDDPVPDVPGRVCHDQFLRTDGTFVNHTPSKSDLEQEAEWTRKYACYDETYNGDDVFWRGSQSAIVYGVMDGTLQTYYVNNAGRIIRQPADPEQEPETYPIAETWYANAEKTSYWPSHFRLIPAPNNAAYLMGAKNIYGINLNKGAFSEPLHTMNKSAAANFCYYGIQLTADNQLNLYANSNPNYTPPLYETIPAPEIPGLDIMFCGENITWSLSNGVLTLTGTGSTYDYCMDDSEDCVLTPWLDYADRIQEISVGVGITGLGKEIFKNLPNVSAIGLPRSTIYIGADAFSGCPVQDIYYSGPETMRENIEIGESNSDFENAAWHYKSYLPGIVCLELENVPDEAFRAVLAVLDANEDTALDSDELSSCTALTINNADAVITVNGEPQTIEYSDGRTVRSLEGIGALTSLAELHGNLDTLTELDLSGCISLTVCDLPERQTAGAVYYTDEDEDWFIKISDFLYDTSVSHTLYMTDGETPLPAPDKDGYIALPYYGKVIYGIDTGRSCYQPYVVIYDTNAICSADFETVTVNGQTCLEVTTDGLDSAALVSRLLNRNEIRVLDAAGQPLGSGMYVGTGCTVQFADDSDISAVVVIPGDVDGNGSMNMNDIVLARRAVLGYETFSGVYLAAATPASGADKPTLSDVTAMRRYCLGVTDSLRLYGVS